MSIGSTKKIESAVSAPTKARPSLPSSTAGRQFVEDIDTTNNVLVRDESDQQGGSYFGHQSTHNRLPNFKSAEADISTSIEALALTGALENDTEKNNNDVTHRKVNIYNSNQSMIKDEEVERTGRNYLKRFYEENKPIIDIDELV